MRSEKLTVSTLICLNLFLAGFLYFGEETDNSLDLISITSSPRILWKGDGLDFNPHLGTMVFFIHSENSCACIDDWPNWVSVYERFKTDLNFIAVFNGQREQDLLDFAQATNLPIPIIHEDDSQIISLLNVAPGTITKAFLDRSNNIRYLDSTQDHPRDQKFFMKRVENHIDSLKPF